MKHNLIFKARRGGWAICVSFFVLSFAVAPDARAQWIQLNGSGGGTPQGYCIVGSEANVFIGGNGGYVDRSTDNGVTWTETNVGFNTTVNWLLLNGRDILAGTEMGVFLSSDQGTNWTYDSTGMGEINISSLVVTDSSGTGDTIIAGTVGPNYIYRSINGGLTWAVDTTGLCLGGAGLDYSIHSISAMGPMLLQAHTIGVLYFLLTQVQHGGR